MSVKVVAFNGSPRKKWNTAMLLEKVLEGAASQGADTELIHIYDLKFTGCVSCFACKTIGGKSYGKCAAKDDLSLFLEKIGEVDALILGSPIYFGTVSGEMKSLMERLLFPYLAYTSPPQKLFTRRINTGFIYTMNASEESMKEFRTNRIAAINEFVMKESLPALETYQATLHIAINQYLMKMVFGTAESLLCCQTYQFEDYSKVVSSLFDPQERAQRRKEVFPKDCEKAFEMGARFAMRNEQS
jgi:multimeric flavodoxin WrbA